MAISSQSTPRLLISQVGILASLEKTIPMGQLCMCAFQWYQKKKKNWQYLQSLVVRIPVSNPSEKAFSVVENAKKKWEIGCLFHTQVHYSLIFVDALNQG